MVASSIDRPGKLLGLSPADLREALGQTEEQAARIARLLERGMQAAVELERLAGRGIWVMTRSDDDYPGRLRTRLRDRRPPVLFGAGPTALLDLGGIAIVGSRDIGDDDRAFAQRLGGLAKRLEMQVVSGGARGVDQAAMTGALDSGGSALGVLADGLERRLRDPVTRTAIADERLTLISPFKPDAGFDVGNAMARNRLIYCLADAAVVVSSGAESGGTWAGATENLKYGWVPLFVRDGVDIPAGNKRLLERGGIPLRDDDLADASDLAHVLDRSTVVASAEPSIVSSAADAPRPEVDLPANESAEEMLGTAKRSKAKPRRARRKADADQLEFPVQDSSGEQKSA
jgi:predicted Rossmann fold nucleotide-binding protein DprA/Smf involved in DNA uptake